MRTVLALVALSLLPTLASPCSIIRVRDGLAEPALPRIVGRVTGYGEEANPVPGVERAVSLHIEVDAVISGQVPRGERSVVPLFYGADCASTSMTYDDVVRLYPVGAAVAVSGSGTAPIPRDRAIPVEQSRKGFVVAVPSGVPRTSEGDLDFARFDSSQNYLLGEFEFDRAVIALRTGDRSQRFKRLMNLAHYPGFYQWPHGRQWFDTLISESGLSKGQRRQVLDAFRRSQPPPQARP